MNVHYRFYQVEYCQHDNAMLMLLPIGLLLVYVLLDEPSTIMLPYIPSIEHSLAQGHMQWYQLWVARINCR